MDIKTILNLMAQYHLTAEELLMIYLTFCASDHEAGRDLFAQWFTSCGGSERLRSIFTSLQEKGVILKSYDPGSTYDPSDIAFNKIFLKGWVKGSYEMGMELFEHFPAWLEINGSYIPARDVSKRFSSLEEWAFFYAKSIGHNPEKHREIIALVDWAVDNHVLNMGILSFTISKQWLALKELRENPEMISTVANICTDE